MECVEFKCSELIPNIKVDLNSFAGKVKMFLCGDLEIGYVTAKEAMQQIGTTVDNNLKNAIKLAEKEHSDLVPGKYEGLYLHLVPRHMVSPIVLEL